jgi:hypothetical protein
MKLLQTLNYKSNNNLTSYMILHRAAFSFKATCCIRKKETNQKKLYGLTLIQKESIDISKDLSSLLTQLLGKNFNLIWLKLSKKYIAST